MKISSLIDKLIAIKAECEDLDIELQSGIGAWTSWWGTTASGIKVANPKTNPRVRIKIYRKRS